MRVAIYARESSDDTNKAPPITEQVERAKQYIQEQGHELYFSYEDNGFSGGNWKRPQWNKLVNDAKRHQFTLVIVWNQDRIARDTEQFLWFYRNLKEAHVKLFSLTDGEIDLTEVGNRVKHTSLAQASEIFRLVTSDKVKKAYEAKKKKEGENLKWGRPKGKYDIKKMQELRDQGLGYRAIGIELSCSYQTVRRMLLNTHKENKDISEGKELNSRELHKHPIK